MFVLKFYFGSFWTDDEQVMIISRIAYRLSHHFDKCFIEREAEAEIKISIRSHRIIFIIIRMVQKSGTNKRIEKS